MSDKWEEAIRREEKVERKKRSRRSKTRVGEMGQRAMDGVEESD